MKPEIEIYGRRDSAYSIDSLSVELGESKHDMFSAYIPRPGAISVDDIKGAPCKVTWGSALETQSIVGYLDTVTELSGDNGLDGWAFMGLGATAVMRSGQARTFRRAGPLRIAKNIVGPYRMALVVDQYISTLDQFMQTSESDWGALIELAQATGMALVGSGTTVQLVDVRRAIGRARLRPVRDLSAPDSFVKMDTPSPVGFDTYEFFGIDRLGATFSVRGGPEGGVKRHANRNFSSLEEARTASRKWEDRQRQLSRAMVSYDGQVRLSCGDVIFCEDDFWFVAEVKHEVTKGGTVHKVSAALQRAEQRRPSTSATAAPPASILRGGKWVAAQAYEVEL